MAKNSEYNVEEFTQKMHELDHKTVIDTLTNSQVFTNNVISYLYNLCSKAIEDKSDKAIEAYRFTLGEISVRLNSQDVTQEEWFQIVDKMIEISEKINEINKDNRTHKLRILGGFATAAGLTGTALVNNKNIRRAVIKGAKAVARIARNIKV